MTTYDTILLAGDGKSAKKVFGKNKSLLEVKGVPCFIRVLAALQRVDSVGEIRIVGPAEEIQSLLDKYSEAWSGPKTVKVLPQKKHILDNIKSAFLDSIPGYQKGMESSPEIKEKPVLLVASDIPLITPDEINEFIDKCDFTRFDYYFGVVSEKTLSHYSEEQGRRGIKMAVLPIKENNYRINNLHLFKPFKVANWDRLQTMYELRYQRQWHNVSRMLAKLLNLEGIKGAVLLYILLQSTLFFRKIGFSAVSNKISAFLPLSRFESIIGKIIGTRISLAETTYGGAALDIDNKTDFKVINEKFDEWMEYQKNKV